jgi:chromosome segregation ATPase
LKDSSIPFHTFYNPLVLFTHQRNELLRSQSSCQQLTIQLHDLQNSAQTFKSEAAALRERCVKMGDTLLTADVASTKLKELETDMYLQQEQIRALKTSNMEVEHSLSVARESLHETVQKKAEACNANTSMLNQLELKTEKYKDLAERHERCQNIWREDMLALQKATDALREELMRERADAMCASRIHEGILESKNAELAATVCKLQNLTGVEYNIQVVQATLKATEKEKRASGAQVEVLKKELSVLQNQIKSNETEISRLINVENSNEISSKLAEEKSVEVHILAEKIKILTAKYEGVSSWKLKIQDHIGSLCEQMEVSDVGALAAVVLEHKKLLQTTDDDAKELQRQLGDTLLQAESMEQNMLIKIEQLEQELITTNLALKTSETNVHTQRLLVGEMQAELTSLKASTGRSQTDLAGQITAMVKEAKSQKTHLQAQLQTQRGRVSHLEAGKLELLQEAEELNKKLVAESKAKADLEGQLAKLFGELGAANDDLAAAEDKIESQAESLKQLGATVRGLRVAQTTTVSKESADAMEQEFTGEMTRLNEEVGVLRAKNDDLEALLKTMTRTNKKMEAGASDKRSQLQDAAKVMALLKSESQAVHDEQSKEVTGAINATFCVFWFTLHSSLFCTALTLFICSLSCVAVQSELKASQARMKSLLSSARDEVDELSCSLRAATKMKKQNQDEMDLMRESKRDLAEKNRNFEKASAKMRVDHELLKQEKRALTLELKRVNHDLKALAVENEGVAMQLSELRRKEGMLATDLRRQLVDLQQEHSVALDQLRHHDFQAEDNNAKVQRMQATTDVTVNGLMQQISSLETESKHDKESHQKEIQTLKEQWNSLDRDLDHVKESSKKVRMGLGQFFRCGLVGALIAYFALPFLFLHVLYSSIFLHAPCAQFSMLTWLFVSRLS